MDAERWQRIGAIFDQVVDAPAGLRGALLDRLCGADATLRGEVGLLLAADTDAARFEQGIDFARSAAALHWVEHDDVQAAGTGQRVGPWRLLEELGRGGMGVVWLAERADGQFQQRAALKLIKRGTDSDAVQARFLRERQILAHLEHPHIARLLDGGIAPDGLPYFAMEYVEGLPLLQYAAQQRLGLDERIHLFLEVCSAVQFAHRRLIVHLDLKPSNVLITSAGTVKLLDFGIAKLLGAEIDDATGTGDAANRPLTPAYASPEQLAGSAVSTATDVYSLGAILYELLTGHRMHDFGAAPTRDEMRRWLDAPAPPAPSRRAAADAPVAARRLRGDLDTIVLTAIKREPERRYPTVNALADDLQRHLERRPVAARRDSTIYRTRKFVLRHRAGTALAGLAVIGLCVATAFALWEAGRAREQARQAETITGFLIDTFRVADPKGAPGGARLSAIDVLDAGAQRLDGQLASEPELGARFAEVLGAIYLELGQYDRATALFDRSLALRPAAADGLASANVLTQLARARYEKGDYAVAEKNLDSALDVHRKRTGASSAIVARDVALQGEIARRQGDFAKAEPLLQAALTMSRAGLKAPNAQIASDLNELAALYSDMHKLDAGTALTEEALAMFRTLYGENHLDVAENLVNLGSFRMQAGQLAAALAPLEQATAIYRRLLPADHPLLANALVVQGNALDRLGRYREAEPLYLGALAMQRRVLGEQHPDVAATLNNLCVMYRHDDEFARSADYCRQALDVWTAAGKPDHPFALASKSNLSVALRETGNVAESERLVREVLTARLRPPAARSFLVPYTMDQLGIVLHEAGRSAEAVVQHEAAQTLRKELPGTPPLEIAAAQVDFALSELDVGNLAAANEQADRAMQTLDAIHPFNPERVADASLAKARIALAAHDIETGCTAAKKALDLRPADDPKTGWRHAEALAVHGECLAGRKEFAAARKELGSALADLQRVRGPAHWRTQPARVAYLALPSG